MNKTKPIVEQPDEVTSDERELAEKAINECSEEYSAEDKDKRESKEKLNQEIEDIKANRELRDKYSFKAFKVVKKSLWGWAILLFVYGLIKFLTRHEENGGFAIFSDHVLIAITTATTLNIFAAFLSLIRGLFPSASDVQK